VIDGHFGKIAKCNQCGLMFRVTIIGQHPVEHSGGSERLAQQYEIKQSLQLVDYEKSFSTIDLLLKGKKGDLLEVGSHTGHFLNLASGKGWKVKGVEPNQLVAVQSIKNFGLDVVISDLRGADLPKESFDVVVMFHVIEHFTDPVAELTKLSHLLRRGGILVVETPRFDTIWFKILKEQERSVIPDHLFYFTRKTLTDMLVKTGFSVKRLDTVGRTLTLDRLLTANVTKSIGVKPISDFIVSVSDSQHLDRFKLYINIGDMMRAYAQKI
jgi:SAM-dependent methyltransferase